MLPYFVFVSFPCSADHERGWPPCKVVFFGLATSTLNARNNNNSNNRRAGIEAEGYLFIRALVVCCVVLTSSAAAAVYMYFGHTYSKSMDPPGKVANPARGQLNRVN